MVDLHYHRGADTHLSGYSYDAGGIVRTRNGLVFYSMAVGQDADGDYEVRIENGTYWGYTRDGRICTIKMIDGRKHWVRASDKDEDLDIVEFRRCTMDEAERQGIRGLYDAVRPQVAKA